MRGTNDSFLKNFLLSKNCVVVLLTHTRDECFDIIKTLP